MPTYRERLIATAVLYVIGYGLLIWSGGWKVALGVFFVNCAIKGEMTCPPERGF